MSDKPKPDVRRSSRAARFVGPLPPRPDLEQQRKRAKQLLRAVHAGEAGAIERCDALHPRPPKPSDAKLADAQLVIARGYGFSSWAGLKSRIEELTKSPVQRFADAVRRSDINTTRDLLESHEQVRAAVNDPLFDFGGLPIHEAGNDLAMFDLLVRHGAAPNARSDWKPGGFTVLDRVNAEMVDSYLRRGVVLTPHIAARDGRLDDLRRLLDENPSRVNEPGGDGQHPLHVAGSVAVIDLLVDRGAEVDARDVDHTSTPARYLAGRPELCRRLLEHGSKPDLFMAAALGDAALARACIQDDPDCVNHRLNRPPWVHGQQGDIYNWVLGHDVTPYQVACKKGHDDVARLILDMAPAKTRLLEAIWHGEGERVQQILHESPGVLSDLDDDDRTLLPRACWWYRPQAVGIMLELGFDPHVAGVDDSTPLDRAAFHGYADLVERLLAADPHPPLDRRNAYGGTPLGACIHGAVHGWDTGHPQDHAATVQRLVDAGSAIHVAWIPTGRDDLDAVLRAALARLPD